MTKEKEVEKWIHDNKLEIEKERRESNNWIILAFIFLEMNRN